MYWFADRETGHWKEALRDRDVTKVERKVSAFYLSLDENQGLSAGLIERLDLRQLVADTATLFEERNHTEKYLPSLKALLDGF